MNWKLADKARRVGKIQKTLCENITEAAISTVNKLLKSLLPQEINNMLLQRFPKNEAMQCQVCGLRTAPSVISLILDMKGFLSPSAKMCSDVVL